MSRNKRESKAIAENALRWCSNILIEVNANHVSEILPKTREEMMILIRQIAKVQMTLQREKIVD